MPTEPGAAPALIAEDTPVPCPRHHSIEAVRRVPAVCADVFAGDVAALLSPRPALRSGDRLTWAGTGVGVAGLAAAWIGTAIGGGSGTTMLGTMVFWCGIAGFAVALALYGRAMARRSRLARVQRGAPAALALWRTAWYCERCDGVYFDGSGDGPGPGGDGLLSAAEFRRLVWSAGGYG